MSKIEILSLIITLICVASFATVFTVLFRHYYKGMISDVKDGKLDIELIDNALYGRYLSTSLIPTFSAIIKLKFLIFFTNYIYHLKTKQKGNLSPNISNYNLCMEICYG